MCEGSQCKAVKPGDSCYIERKLKGRAGPTWTQGKGETRVGKEKEGEQEEVGGERQCRSCARWPTAGHSWTEGVCVVGEPEGVAAARARQIDKEKKRVVKE